MKALTICPTMRRARVQSEEDWRRDHAEHGEIAQYVEHGRGYVIRGLVCGEGHKLILHGGPAETPEGSGG